jgi:hypothetical protein
MRKVEHLWRALEGTPVLTGVRAAWDQIGGPDLGLLLPFLRVRPDQATAYPCPEPGAHGCPRGVVVHGPDDIVAVCRASPRRCETITLKKSDLAIYQLDLSKLGASLSAHFGFSGDVSSAAVDGLRGTVYLGTYCPVAGHQFPAYLTLQHDADEFSGVMERLTARDARPFILFAPTADFVTPTIAAATRARGSLILALADVTAADAAGHLVVEPADTILAPLRDAVLNAAEARSDIAFFATPAAATWEHVEIRFKDGHTVSVKALAEQGVFNYTQMGMANRKNAEPTRQWDLLKAFAVARGHLTWDSPDADRKNQKRREILSKDLRAFFRIEGDPITSDGGGWRARFKLHDES